MCQGVTGRRRSGVDERLFQEIVEGFRGIGCRVIVVHPFDVCGSNGTGSDQGAPDGGDRAENPDGRHIEVSVWMFAEKGVRRIRLQVNVRVFGELIGNFFVRCRSALAFQ